MDKTQMLFIRACKSSDPKIRLVSVYRRFYNPHLNTEERKPMIALILSKIVDQYRPYTESWSLLDLLSPSNDWRNGTAYWDKVINVLMNRIRFSGREKFPGFIPPLKFRTKEVV